ncbi:MAG: hypothetical protein NZM12_06405 [Steroidobacteraceae bacterium]|nr:hypothetical protein [Steroidobacteraceae bacterium]MDW8259296.1 hypothetical protein [Gammaproteobacteria bacterium]
MEGVTSFSTTPLRIWAYVGPIVALGAFAYGAYIVMRWYGVDVPGYASLLVAILFLGGIQLIGLGMIGEYLGRTYAKSMRRPVYIARAILRRSMLSGPSVHVCTPEW